MAAALRKQPGVEVEVINGARGEFTVLVDGREVVRKGGELPDVDRVVEKVREAAGHPSLA